MSTPRFTAIVLVALVAFAGTRAGAQSASASAAPPAAARDPGDAMAAVPAVIYTSAFARYRLNAEAEVGAWRDMNDNVGRIGGWRIYGREAIAEPKTDNPRAAGGRSEGGAAAKPEHGHTQRGAR